ncbi:hypothetical protein VTK56DRAFT_3656 [Thermocarpiscus australiensis]
MLQPKTGLWSFVYTRRSRSACFLRYLAAHLVRPLALPARAPPSVGRRTRLPGIDCAQCRDVWRPPLA